MKRFAITNANARKVVCVDVPDDSLVAYYPNKDLLKVEKQYNVVKVVVRDWFTIVYLAEFPNIYFNSEQFAELN